ncbi:MAG: YceI family protein [Chitinophagales bacterium]|nr:YceI family protein [Chitinophagales bacterium]
MIYLRLLFSIVFINAGLVLSAQELYYTDSGIAYFKSEAPLEVIEATSNELKGVIDPLKRTFAFSIRINSFEGFNSPLQREHFNENYMESKQYKEATFKGKIIEQEDLTKNGSYTVRAKGVLNIHGVTQERIIRSTVITKEGEIQINSSFTVLVAEHDITIPRIVYQKIAEEIQVEIKASLKKK